MSHHKTLPRRVDFTDPQGPDARIVQAISYGKSYKAAASLSRSTVGQVGYRLRKINDSGVYLSPRQWRESALPKDQREIRQLDRQFRNAQRLLNQLKAKFPRELQRRKGRQR